MNIKLKNVASLLLSCLLSFSFIPYINGYALEPSSSSDEVTLVLDNKNTNIPIHFRKTSDLSNLDNKSLNLTGLQELNISGSEQFSQLNLKKLLSAIDTKLPIIDIDLRGECHGFINGFPVSWKNRKNNANEGLTKDEILNKEKNYLKDIKLNVPLKFSNDNELTITPKDVFTEKELMDKNYISYVRITATDRVLPTPEDIDDFIKIILNTPREHWLHFHCELGIGRTTSFMIFYDMMKNYKNVSAQDIISRQINLPDFSEHDVELLTKDDRMTLYNNFYNYCVKYGDKFDIPYSEYVSSLTNGNSLFSYPIDFII